MRRICDQLRQASQRLRLALIEGEAGAGKHLIARHLHALGTAQGAFVAEEATTLFGDGPGSSEAAGAALRHAFKRAAEGMLLIRNIDDLHPEQQAQLLRFIRSFETTLAMGKSDADISVHQLVCTARQSLRALVMAGRYLPEIYYRLSAVSFSLPPLRERREDIPALTQAFIEAASQEHRKTLQGLGPGSLALLLRHRWPGNVRELESVVRAACLNAEHQWLRPIDFVILPLDTPRRFDPESALPQDYNLDAVIRRHILRVLKACDGNKARAASRLGISRSTLYRMLESETSRSEGEANNLSDDTHDALPSEEASDEAPVEVVRAVSGEMRH